MKSFLIQVKVKVRVVSIVDDKFMIFLKADGEELCWELEGNVTPKSLIERELPSVFPHPHEILSSMLQTDTENEGESIVLNFLAYTSKQPNTSVGQFVVYDRNTMDLHRFVTKKAMT